MAQLTNRLEAYLYLKETVTRPMQWYHEPKTEQEGSAWWDFKNVLDDEYHWWDFRVHADGKIESVCHTHYDHPPR